MNSEGKTAGSIFLSYRREDSADVAGRIYDWLCREFPAGKVFKDVDSIPYGVDFRDHLKTALTDCKVVLVLIGPRWCEARNQTGERRLDDPSDYVRIETEIALSRRPEVTVIPVIVGGAHVPNANELPESLRDLCYIHSPQIRRDPDFANDVGRLIARLKALVDSQTSAIQPAPSENSPQRTPARTSVWRKLLSSAKPWIPRAAWLWGLCGGLLFGLMGLYCGAFIEKWEHADSVGGPIVGFVWGVILGFLSASWRWVGVLGLVLFGGAVGYFFKTGRMDFTSRGLPYESTTFMTCVFVSAGGSLAVLGIYGLARRMRANRLKAENTER